VFELWDACAIQGHGTEEALSNAKRVARNAVSSRCAKNARRIHENARGPVDSKDKRNAASRST
jgi:hypothetical protein